MIKVIHFSFFIPNVTTHYLASILVDAKIMVPHSRESWGDLVLTDYYASRDKHTFMDHLLFFEARIDSQREFNAFKIKEPDNYIALSNMINDPKLPKSVSQIPQYPMFKNYDPVSIRELVIAANKYVMMKNEQSYNH